MTWYLTAPAFRFYLWTILAVIMFPIIWALHAIVHALGWKPLWTTESCEQQYKTVITQDDLDRMQSEYDIRCAALSIDSIACTGDGGKFLGCAYLGNPNDTTWAAIKSLWGPDTFCRYPYVMEDENKEESNSSTDQMAGILPSIYHRYKSVGLTEDELNHLRVIFDNICFKGRPMSIKHPYGMKVDRGYLWEWWNPLLFSDCNAGMLMLAMGKEFFPDDNRYSFAYSVLWFLYNRSFDCLNHNVCLRWPFGIKILETVGAVAMKWYVPHNRALISAALYDITHDPRILKGLEGLTEDYPYNADMLMLYVNATGWEHSEQRDRLFGIVATMAEHAKGSYAEEAENKAEMKVFNALKLERVTYKQDELTAMETNIYHLWEKSRVKIEYGGNVFTDVDYILAARYVLKYLQQHKEALYA